MANNNDDDGFDLIQPTLIQHLRKILDEYPDDGQILKELIQNAEDASATHVKFLHDKHSYGTAQLYDDREELRKFQGPALYSYNNARFTKEDWKGIRLVCDSIKVEDPMKVGRFGLGFKSVFHMTDLPSLFSESQIGFIDPLEVHFSDRSCRRTGKRWRLREDRMAMEEIPDQFIPYKGIFGCSDEVFSQGFYDGTLFRFPLRSTPSELSDTLYSAEKVGTLFESFKADAHLMLLFLQHLESIELYVREESESEPRRVFQVKIDEERLQTVREKRKEFHAKITPGKVMPSSVSVTYPVTIETVTFDLPSGDSRQKYSFLVTNYFCGGQVSSTFKNLMTDKALSYLPMVGVAMALPSVPRLLTPDIRGHVFCFLPLPVQKTSLTGLPVHVNGFFALHQNRRYIKSPNADQEDRDKAGRYMTDRSLLWNKCLLEEAIPRAYATMILQATKEKVVLVPTTAIYKAWPDIDSIHHRWRGIEKPFFQLLLEENVVHTQADGGSWVKIEDAIFQRQSEGQQNELLLRILISVGLSAVTVPGHVQSALDRYIPDKTEIKPLSMRLVLRQVPSCYTKLDRKEKLFLLQFCLRDRNFSDLDGLQLLPLSNGQFVKFENRAKAVYIASPEHPQELFPGVRDCFLDKTVEEGIIGNLQAAALQGKTQLQLLSASQVPSLLWHSLPLNWRYCDTVLWYPDNKAYNHPAKGWVQLVWNYLRSYFTKTEDLQRLQGLPLIPLNMFQTPTTLTQLCHPSRVVIKRFNDDCIDDSLEDVLTKIGVLVMRDCPAFISQHLAVLGTFINRPSIQGSFRAMVVCASNVGNETFLEKVRGLSPKEKQILRSFLSNVRPEYIGKDDYNLLCHLPLFETHSKKFVSRKDGLCAMSPDSLPIQPLRDLIDVSKEDSKTLARSLNVRILEPTELLCEMVFPDMKQGRYSEEQVDRLMPFVLRHFGPVIRSNAIFNWNVQVLPFVPSQTERVRASEVFDPRSTTLQEIFAHEDVFPVGELYNDPDILIMLEGLGMKGENKITAEDIFQSAQEVCALPPSQSVQMKSQAILQYLCTHPEKLQEPALNGTKLGVLLRNRRWVSRLRQKTPNFPPSLPWWEAAEDEEEEMHFFKPSELKSHQFANLIGTVKPVLDVKTSNEICCHFGWQAKPDLYDVVKNLQNVVTFYTKEENLYYVEIVRNIYMFFCSMNYEALNRAFQQLNVVDWVWNGDGFSPPCKILPGEPTVDLTPFIIPLPREVMKFSTLFQRFGMRTQSDPALLLQVLGMIKEKYDNSNYRFSPSEVKRELKLSVEILNEVADEQLSPELQEKILLPTHVEDNSYIRLEGVERCMYCEHDDWLKREGDHEELEYFYVHANVPSVTAERLRVPSLTNRMLDPDELYFGEEFGQEEKLTTRLNRLLEEYKDGFAVPKELIQNADDAGATEVRFLYDERTNEDAMTCLIDEGMRGCQGPALWVYNDATFTDEDFVNITKLNEATKAHDTEKIGRFGLGFNAVYNVTDVPMFVSRNYFAIFDPHTTYLGKAIRNKGKPGIKINLNKAVKRRRKYSNQFKPFNGIFGCDLHLHKEDNSFEGTLFRFPLRTRVQAIASEIKQLYYDDQQMRELLAMFLHGAKHLLLFTQNVLRVGIYHVGKLGGEDPNPVLMFEVTKSTPQGGILRELSFSFTRTPTAWNLSPEELSVLKQCNFLQASSKMKRLAPDEKIDPRNFPKSSMIVDVNCSFTKYGLDFFNNKVQQEKITWLVVSSMGTGQAMNVAKNNPSLLPAAGVAVQLEPRGSNSFEPLPAVKKVDRFNVNGTIFCYLPLPIHSGLLVHINGAFAVASNRRHLLEKVEDDKTWFGVDWNKALLQDSVVSAFLDLLEDVKSIIPNDGSYVFHSLWPKASEVQRSCLPFLSSFYAKLTGGDFLLFSDGMKWVGIKQIVFLDPQFRKESQIGEAANKVLQLCFKGSRLVVDLPFDVLYSFEVCNLKREIDPRCYSKSRFFDEIFFPNIATLPPYLRDVLTLHALDANCKDFNQLIMLHACIPASPAGNTLKLPHQLVRPDREAASLFGPEDGRFPFGSPESYLGSRRLAILEHLGMASSDLPWYEVAERAESIHNLNAVDSGAALKRGKALLSFMERKMNFKSSPDPTFYSRISKAKFLPVLKKPNDFPLPWKGDELEDNSLLAPEEAYLEEQKYLVCCTEPLVGILISRKVKKLLNLDTRGVTLEQVMQQLTNAFSARVQSLNSSEYKELEQVCTATYACLQQSLSVYGKSILEALRGERFILDGRRFLSAQQVAFSLTADCSPYLFKLPQWIAVCFGPLMKEAGVKLAFVAQDYISCLCDIKSIFEGNALDESTLQVASRLAVLLGETVRATNFDVSVAKDNWGVVHLPDSKGVMTPVPDLCIRDCPWMPDEEGVKFVNDSISWPICAQLGVKTRRQEALRPHVRGIPFGQREKLTNRLKRILIGYPCEKEILKELLQNADDAQATEISFIKDPRNHPDKRVFEDSWKQLQGPALCVYNNKPFTSADMEGIRNLGEGSKGEDPNKTGQYGVGFNAVYHLTDVPSFMSKVEDIGDVLCAFDPHCKYVPGATIKEPGQMFDDIATLRKRFPDVFSCYLEDHFATDSGTMFRFPLRTEEMFRLSQISSNHITLTLLNTMMEDLKKEMFEVLLFVKNVRKITLCEVNGQTGKLANAYSVEATMSKEDEAKRQAFADYIKQIGARMKEGQDLLPSDIPLAKVSYVLNIADNLGSKEKWLIVQQMGFEKEVSRDVTNAFRKQQLCMLPRGGVACLLDRTSRDPGERGNKAFCFLPLPIETDLPVHINGHFILGHEARRNLWRDEAGGYRSDWNNALLEDVVASCYLTLLVEVRAFLQLPIGRDASPCVMRCTESEILQRISAYERFFPLKPPTEPYWKTLVDSLYQNVDMKELKVLPVVRRKPLDVTHQELNDISVVEITWFPPTGHGNNQAFFNNLAETEPFGRLPQKERDQSQTKARRKFEEILLASGFNLVAFSTALHISFQQSQVRTCVISPTTVVDFYKSISSQEPLCKIGQFPSDVNSTPFRDVHGVVLALLYCKGMQDFFDQLPGLPMLLTQDNCLQMFSSKDTKFLSRFKDILPGSPQVFLHELVHRKVFSDGPTLKSSVLKPLNAEGFTTNLPQTLPRELYGKGNFVEWSPDQKTAPNQRWISRVWVFLGELTRDILNDPSIAEESKQSQIKATIGSLASWSILPANEVKIVQKKKSLLSMFSSSMSQPAAHFWCLCAKQHLSLITAVQMLQISISLQCCENSVCLNLIVQCFQP